MLIFPHTPNLAITRQPQFLAIKLVLSDDLWPHPRIFPLVRKSKPLMLMLLNQHMQGNITGSICRF